MAYLSSVSMAAIMLSLYYIFIWNPMPSNAAQVQAQPLISSMSSLSPVTNAEIGE